MDIVSSLFYIDVHGRKRRELIKPRRIVITRAEGPHKMVGKTCAAQDWIGADAFLRDMASAAPKGGGYDKHDFVVLFEDGASYSGCYDLKHWGEEIPNLALHVRGFIRYLAGRSPGWMNEQQRKAYEADRAAHPNQVAEAKHWLETYDLGQTPPYLDEDPPA